MTRERMEFDVVIVGAGPAGLACAIRLKQAAAQAGREVSVCVLEKGAEVGAHILSGAVIETRALDELLPDWRALGAPITTAARKDRFLFLTESRAIPLPTPPQMHNEGNWIVSLGQVCRWLANQAEALGVEIYAGFAAAEVLYEGDRVVGVATGDMGLARDGTRKPSYQPGIELRATYTLFAEGCRGHLTKTLEARYGLREGRSPQTYAIGLKELWEVPKDKHEPGLVLHTIGWPLDRHTYGGSFLYHFGDNLMAYGFVIGLDYRNPWLSPYDELQRFKLHPKIRPYFEGGRRIGYGARALNEGGLQAIPRLVFPGGAIIGCAAGFLNVPKIKGTHTAMKSGMLAAEAVAEALAGSRPDVLEAYPSALEKSWVWDELRRARNIRPAFARFGLWGGLVYAGLDTYLLRGRAPWTFSHHADHETLEEAARAAPIDYPKPDGTLTFGKLDSVALANVAHEDDQPVHLRLADPDLAISHNWARYRSPETRYCPAGVYEIVGAEEGKPRLVINAGNCVHCKTCDIKDPRQNITWVAPEGGGGPAYAMM
ncbi:electron transfer flavoprotein-ubiquinone oxidoreductase [Elioraea thermophila]|uniref:electron transfer flavoprotein-ubiquinone oxidoreductase n=1 Tax=Elioraea thermophila TaxID=2185104 RepID=UPI000DF3D816|nr:electron transfer flavoprotein-ubiquinone oxidoreductase [Elioraea thermophila]